MSKNIQVGPRPQNIDIIKLMLNENVPKISPNEYFQKYHSEQNCSNIIRNTPWCTPCSLLRQGDMRVSCFKLRTLNHESREKLTVSRECEV